MGLMTKLLAKLLRSLSGIKPQVDTVEGATGRFGYEETNPIAVDGQQGELHYLACLRCHCGRPFNYHRRGSAGACPDGHIVDIYELRCQVGEHSCILYMDMYHGGATTLVPDDLSVDSPEGFGIPFCVENFPDGLDNYRK